MNRHHYFFFIFYFIVTQASIAAKSTDIIILTDSTSREIQEFDFISDTSKRLTFSQVLSSAEFKKYNANTSLTLDNRVYWLRFSILNTSNYDTEYLLNFDNWHKVNLFYSSNGKTFQDKTTGHLVPFLKRDFPFENKNLIALNIKSNEFLTCYARIETTHNYILGPQKISFTITPKAEYLKGQINDRYIRGIFLGFFLVMLLYNTFLWISTRDNSYIYYLMILFLVAYLVPHNTGTTFEIFKNYENFPIWFSRIDLLGGVSLCIAYWFLMKSFLNFKIHFPFLNKISPLLIPFFLMFPILGLFIPPMMAFKFLLPFIVGFCPISLITSTIAYKRRIPSAGYFLLANTVLLVAGVFSNLHRGNLLPDLPLIRFSMFIGFSIQNVLFSLAFANNINVLKRENEKKQNEIIGHLRKNEEYLKLSQELELNAEKLKKEVIASEFESLKNQVNPHFLFNSLNVLTELVYKSQDNAVNFILELSGVYRYVLENKRKEVVQLSTEISFINSYIYLLKIRFGKNLNVDFDIPEGNHFFIAPLTLQLLVENAIKHNIISEEKPLHIIFKIEDGYIVISNNLQIKGSVIASTGIGIENIISRYKYLTDKEVLVEKDSGKFTVKIPLIKMDGVDY